jgi:hypothetical protein
MDTVGFCWIILFAEAAGAVIPRALRIRHPSEDDPGTHLTCSGILARFVLIAQKLRK